MVRVEDDATFEQVLRAARAILVLHAEWSMPSVLVLRIVQRWEEHLRHASPPAARPLFVAINRDEYPAPVIAWLKASGLERYTATGWGEVLWLEDGRVVALAHGGANVTASELTRRTAELWQSD
jgi:hypothetical protein